MKHVKLIVEDLEQTFSSQELSIIRMALQEAARRAPNAPDCIINEIDFKIFRLEQRCKAKVSE